MKTLIKTTLTLIRYDLERRIDLNELKLNISTDMVIFLRHMSDNVSYPIQMVNDSQLKEAFDALSCKSRQFMEDKINKADYFAFINDMMLRFGVDESVYKQNKMKLVMKILKDNPLFINE